MTTVGSGQTLNVSNGQVSAGVIVFSGGVLDVLSGGETTGVVVGGAEIVSSGGVASATIVSGGILAVFSGGLAIGALISGGDVYISAGGTVFTTDVEGGGNEIVVNGGAASGGDVEGAHAQQTVYGFAGGAILVSGGLQLVNSGGSASATTVNDGGYLLVQSGGVAAGAIISGGTFELAGGGATGTARVTFETSAGGTLRLDDSVAFGGLIAGFGKPDYLDLSDIAFGSGTHLTFFSTPPQHQRRADRHRRRPYRQSDADRPICHRAVHLGERRPWRHADRRSPRHGGERAGAIDRYRKAPVVSGARATPLAFAGAKAQPAGVAPDRCRSGTDDFGSWL